MSNLPPPLPPGGQTPPPPVPTNNNAAIPGTEGMTIEQLEEEVRNGGRFVFYSYAISIVFMTFKRSSSVRFLKRGQDGTAAAFGYSLLSFLFGWWGIPWGPIYTIGALIQNARGGKDVTLQVMAALTGQVRATQTFSERRKPAAAGLGMILFRAALIAAPVAIFFSIVKAATDDTTAEGLRRKKPGYAAYESANDNLTKNISGGNNAEATALAQELRAVIRLALLISRTANKSSENVVSEQEPIVWCNYNQKSLVVLVKFSKLRKFDQESQLSIAELVWESTHKLMTEKKMGSDAMQVATGLRGVALYDSVMTGPYHPEGANPPEETLKHSAGIDKLIPIFAIAEVSPSVQ